MFKEIRDRNEHNYIFDNMIYGDTYNIEKDIDMLLEFSEDAMRLIKQWKRNIGYEGYSTKDFDEFIHRWNNK
jgi:hypothetical protein